LYRYRWHQQQLELILDSEIFSQRFRANASAGHDELQGYINRATPSIGYLFLAQILTNTKHKFVLTTNFDTMTEDALFSLQNAKNAKPLIIGHTSLANYISVNNSVRPVIVKLHHDYLLSSIKRSNPLISTMKSCSVNSFFVSADSLLLSLQHQ
jgi:NAD-dependent SIR2 family protein deacetylase